MLLPLLMNLGMFGKPIVPAKGSSKRIHPRWIREDEESELPEVIRKRTKLTKKVEALLQKQEAITEAKLGRNAVAMLDDRLAREIDEEEEWLLLMQ